MKVSHKFCIIHATDDCLYSIGKSEFGALGVPAMTDSKKQGCHIKVPGTVRNIQVGDKHVIALTTEGKVYAWGSNKYG